MATLNYVARSLRNLFTKPATEEFPAKPREYKERYRGHIENDISKCILCGNCMRNCPSDAITVTKAKYTWEIHPFSCVQCSKCVEVCPTKCLKMVNSFTEPGSEKTRIVNRYSDEQIAKEVEKQKALAARVAAAKAAAAAKAKAAAEAKAAQSRPAETTGAPAAKPASAKEAAAAVPEGKAAEEKSGS